MITQEQRALLTELFQDLFPNDSMPDNFPDTLTYKGVFIEADFTGINLTGRGVTRHFDGEGKRREQIIKEMRESDIWSLPYETTKHIACDRCGRNDSPLHKVADFYACENCLIELGQIPAIEGMCKALEKKVKTLTSEFQETFSRTFASRAEYMRTVPGFLELLNKKGNSEEIDNLVKQHWSGSPEATEQEEIGKRLLSEIDETKARIKRLSSALEE